MATKKVTAKSVICEGLLKGWKVPKILEKVAAKVEGSKADESHIRYYVNQLHKSGEMSDELKAKYSKGRGRPAAGKSDAKSTKKATKTAKAAKPAKPAKSAKKEAKPAKPEKKAKAAKSGKKVVKKSAKKVVKAKKS